MAHLPVHLDLGDLPIVAIGGGRVAERRVLHLLRSGARVRLVAPAVTPRLRALARRGRIVWRPRGYRPGDLRGARLVIAATDAPRVNAAVAREARLRGQFVNLADDAAGCSLIFPAVLRRGPLVIAVTTSGECPALARRIRDDLVRRYGSEHGRYVKLVGGLRRRILSEAGSPAERERRCRRLLRAPILGLLRDGRTSEARRAGLRAAGLG